MISIFKEYHAVFSEGDAAPIGDTPSGRSFAGFFIRHGVEEYALVFREATEKDTGVFLIPSEKTNAQIICSNADIVAGIDSGVLKVKFSKQRAFAFVKLS